MLHLSRENKSQEARTGKSWDGTAGLVSRDQIFSRERGQGKKYFSCEADHEQVWQPYPVDLHSAGSYRCTTCTQGMDC